MYKQYEFSIKIDEYIFNRFVKDKCTIKEYKEYKKEHPKCVCNFILRGDDKKEPQIYLWDISERKPLKERI
jgi:hypothetical protein|tara:strand:+ start:443 stop:655 length:213 start_codon:yes stop_codon:yes gene_type:complete